MPVAVRNLSNTTVVLSQPDRKSTIEWGYAEHPDGNDIQQVPESLTEEVSFLRAVARGVLSIEEDDNAFKEAIAKQAQRFATERTADANALEGLLEGPANGRDIVISEDAMNAHIGRLERSQPSAVDATFPTADAS